MTMTASAHDGLQPGLLPGMSDVQRKETFGTRARGIRVLVLLHALLKGCTLSRWDRPPCCLLDRFTFDQVESRHTWRGGENDLFGRVHYGWDGSDQSLPISVRRLSGLSCPRHTGMDHITRSTHMDRISTNSCRPVRKRVHILATQGDKGWGSKSLDVMSGKCQMGEEQRRIALPACYFCCGITIATIVSLAAGAEPGNGGFRRG